MNCQTEHEEKWSGPVIGTAPFFVCSMADAGIDMQLSLYEHIQRLQRQETLDVALGDIRRRFGYEAVQRGIMLADPALKDAKGDHVIHIVAFLQ